MLSTSRLKSPLMAPTLLIPRFIINCPKTLRETVTSSKINCFIKASGEIPLPLGMGRDSRWRYCARTL
jgi:hypothetical protein